MNVQENKKQKKLEERIAYLEKNRRFVQNALEMALSMGDFLESINGKKDVKQILQATKTDLIQNSGDELSLFHDGQAFASGETLTVQGSS